MGLSVAHWWPARRCVVALCTKQAYVSLSSTFYFEDASLSNPRKKATSLSIVIIYFKFLKKKPALGIEFPSLNNV